jgi:GTPase SAR1 family protein|nr:MAG TPA: hypothetical protein [Caudoviricetes sp.]
MKSNIHKKVYPEDKFARKWYCTHARLNQLRSDKRESERMNRRNTKKEIQDWLKNMNE